MKKQNKCLAVLSTAAIGTLVASAVSTTAFAKTTDVIANINGKNVQINFEKLMEAYGNKMAGIDDDSLYNEYASRQTITALVDDKNGVVDYKAVEEANEYAFAKNEKFDLNAFTETTKSVLKDFKADAEWKDGKVVDIEAELKAEKFEAINSKQVEIKFNKAVQASEGMTFKFNGKVVEASQVKYEGSNVIISLADEMVNKYSNTVVVLDKANKEIATDKVVYVDVTPAKLEIVNAVAQSKVGENCTISARILNRSGDIIPNKEVTFESAGNVSFFEKRLQLKAMTDSNGMVKFTYNRVHALRDSIYLYVTENPTLKVKTSVDWYAATDLVTVDAVGQKTVGYGTWQEYNVTAKNEDKSNFEGKLKIELSSGVGENKITSENTQVQYWDEVEKKWISNKKLEGNNNSYTFDMNEAKGKVKFRIRSTEQFKKDNNKNTYNFDVEANTPAVIPTFTYNKETGSQVDNPRAIGTKLNYVQQKPVFIWKSIDKIGNVVKSDENDGKLYQLTVKDQFGNPYMGNIVISTIADADGLAQTKDSSAKILVSPQEDNSFSKDKKGIVLDLGKDTDNKDGNSSMTVKITDAKNETITPVAFAVIGNGQGNIVEEPEVIDDNDVATTADELTFKNVAVSNIVIEPQDGTSMAANKGSKKYFKVTLKDQFGKNISLKKVYKLFDEDTEKIDEATKAISWSIVKADGTNGDTKYLQAKKLYGLDKNKKLDKTKEIDNIKEYDEDSFFIEVTADKKNEDPQAENAILRVWANIPTSDDNFQKDEVNATCEVNLETSVLSQGELNQKDDKKCLIASKKVEGVDYINKSSEKNEFVKFEYTIKDQSKNDYKFKEDGNENKNIVFTITNNGSDDAKYKDKDGNEQDIKAGATVKVIKVITSNEKDKRASVELKAGDNKVGQFTIKAQVEGMDSTSVTKKVLFVNHDYAFEGELSGKVVGFTKDGDQDDTIKANDGSKLVIKSSTNQYFTVDLNKDVFTGKGYSVSIGGTSVGINEKVFEDSLAIGDTITLGANTRNTKISIVTKDVKAIDEEKKKSINKVIEAIKDVQGVEVEGNKVTLNVKEDEIAQDILTKLKNVKTEDIKNVLSEKDKNEIKNKLEVKSSDDMKKLTAREIEEKLSAIKLENGYTINLKISAK